jgi:curved DNA-binding protein CbpA
LLNVPKYVSREDLKKQYHKLAKIYHPDILESKNKATGSTTSLLTDKQRTKLEERFKEFNLAYERLL